MTPGARAAGGSCAYAAAMRARSTEYSADVTTTKNLHKNTDSLFSPALRVVGGLVKVVVLYASHR